MRIIGEIRGEIEEQEKEGRHQGHGVKSKEQHAEIGKGKIPEEKVGGII